MAIEKQRRGFKGKVLLRHINCFDPKIIVRAFEEGTKLYLEIEGGDAYISDFVHVCENEIAAWELHADYIEELTGKRPIRGCS